MRNVYLDKKIRYGDLHQAIVDTAVEQDFSYLNSQNHEGGKMTRMTYALGRFGLLKAYGLQMVFDDNKGIEMDSQIESFRIRSGWAFPNTIRKYFDAVGKKVGAKITLEPLVLESA